MTGLNPEDVIVSSITPPMSFVLTPACMNLIASERADSAAFTSSGLPERSTVTAVSAMYPSYALQYPASPYLSRKLIYHRKRSGMGCFLIPEIFTGNAISPPFSWIMFSANSATDSNDAPSTTFLAVSFRTSESILPARRCFSKISSFSLILTPDSFQT